MGCHPCTLNITPRACFSMYVCLAFCLPRLGGQGKVDGGENETTPRSGLWIVKSNYLPLWRQANEDLADRCELVRVMIRERGEQRGDHSSRPCEQHSQSLFHRVQPHQLSVGGFRIQHHSFVLQWTIRTSIYFYIHFSPPDSSTVLCRVLTIVRINLIINLLTLYNLYTPSKRFLARVITTRYIFLPGTNGQP